MKFLKRLFGINTQLTIPPKPENQPIPTPKPEEHPATPPKSARQEQSLDASVIDPIYEGRRISEWISTLKGPDRDAIPATIKVINAGQLALPQLVIGLKNPNDKIRKMILIILGKMEPEPSATNAVPALLEACRDSDPNVSIGARYALIMITGEVEKHLRVICESLKSSDVVHRRVAASFIGAIGPRALPAARMLFDMLQKEDDPTAHLHAENALQKIGWNPAVGAMPKIDFY